MEENKERASIASATTGATKKVATRGQQIQPQHLPPTSAAARYHSLRDFLQVKQWQCLGEGMQFEDWG